MRQALPADSQTIACAVSFGLSATLSLILLIGYWFLQENAFRLTLQRPFTSWRDVRSLYQDLVGRPVISPADNLTVRVMSAAWCDLPSPRPQIVPANRSEACSCLSRKQAYFINNNTWPQGLYTRQACDAAGDEAVSCLRYRSTWDVWPCGKDCNVHPMALALTCDLGMTMLSLAALLVQVGFSKSGMWGLTALPALAGIGILAVARPIQDFVFMLILVGVWFGIVVALDGELFRDQGRALSVDGELTRPRVGLAIVTCLWFGFPLTVASVSVYVAIAHTVRDLVGVLCYAGLGYLAGLLAQRVHWARCFLVFGADGGGWRLSVHFATVVYKWATYCLGLALAGVWLGLLILAYTQWLGSSPYGAAGVSLTLLLMCAVITVLELAAALVTPRMGRIGELGPVEGAQLALVLALHVIFTVTAIADAAK